MKKWIWSNKSIKYWCWSKKKWISWLLKNFREKMGVVQPWSNSLWKNSKKKCIKNHLRKINWKYWSPINIRKGGDRPRELHSLWYSIYYYLSNGREFKWSCINSHVRVKLESYLRGNLERHWSNRLKFQAKSHRCAWRPLKLRLLSLQRSLFGSCFRPWR